MSFYNGQIRIDATEARGIRSDIERLGLDPLLLSEDLYRLGIGGRRGRLDAGESLVFQRSLLYTMKAIHEVKYPQLKGRLFCPVNNEVNTGADSFSWDLYDMTGAAKIVGDNADDIPTVESMAAEIIQGVKTSAAGYSWNIQQLRAAAFAGVPLQTRKAAAVRSAFERTVETVAATGVGPLPGMLGNASVPIIVAPAITGSWTGGVTTPVQVLADMHYIANYAARTTKDAYASNAMLLPVDQFQYVSSTLINPAGQADATILKAFLDSNPYVKSVDSWSYLATAGTSSVPRAMAYNRSPTSLEMVIPQEFEMLPPQAKNFKMFVPCRMRLGGVTFYEPLSAAYADGI